MNEIVKRSAVGEVSRDAVAPLLPRTAEEVGAYVDSMIRMDAIPASYATLAEHKRRGHMVVAILKGMELGMPPLRALQSIYVVNGIPTIYGDALVAYVMRSGQVESYEEWYEGEGDLRAAFVKAKRFGIAGAVTRSFSLAQALRQGLLNKKGPWQHSRDRMMMIRARTYVFRDLFADCLDGLSVAEEQEDIVTARGLTAAVVGDTRRLDPLADAAPIIDGESFEPAAITPRAAQTDGGGGSPHHEPPPSFLVEYGHQSFDAREPCALATPLPAELMEHSDWRYWSAALADLIKAAPCGAQSAWLARNNETLLRLQAQHPSWVAKLHALANSAAATVPLAADEGAPAADGLGLAGARDLKGENA